jgi:hypothetical protein
MSLTIILSRDHPRPIRGFLCLCVLDLLALHRVDLGRRIGLALDDRRRRANDRRLAADHRVGCSIRLLLE